MQQAYAFCEQLVRDADRDRFLATLFAPVERRSALHALYAFDIEVARVRTLSRQPLPGEIRLQWWRDVLNGERSGEAAANPVAAALNDALARASVAPESLLDLLEAREFDLYDDPMPTKEALMAYARRTSGQVVDAAARLVALGGVARREAADAAGAALTITGVLRNVALHASRRQLYVPVDVLERHGVAIDNVYAGQDSPALRAALGEMRDYVRQNLATLDGLKSRGLHDATSAFLPVALVPLYLARMERRNYGPFRTPIDEPQWRRQWALWRAARG